MREYQHGWAMSLSHCHPRLCHLQLDHLPQDGLMVAEVAEAKQGSACLNVGQRKLLLSPLYPFSLPPRKEAPAHAVSPDPCCCCWSRTCSLTACSPSAWH